MGRSVVSPFAVNGEWLMAMAQAAANASATLSALVADGAAMDLVAANPTLREAIGTSGTAYAAIRGNTVSVAKWAAALAGLNPADYADMDAVAASGTAMDAIAASSTAMDAVATSGTAMDAVIASSTAIAAVVASGTAMAAIAASNTAMTPVAASGTAMAAVAASSTAMAAVAASSTAMSHVATSSTAMNAVIASSTAIAAVVADGTAWTTFKASTALTAASVPTMSSNTAPSGVAAASATTYGAAWQVFDNSAGTRGGGGSPGWVSYAFTADRYIHTMAATTDDQALTSFYAQYSDNNSSWTTASGTYTLNATGNSGSYAVTGSGKHRYWRIYVSGGAYAYMRTLQFTGFV